MMKLSEILFEGVLYHVTSRKNLASIRRNGLKMHSPKDMDDEEGVFLFKDYGDAEDAVMNWLGDRFDEDEELVAIKVNSRFVQNKSELASGFEVISKNDIPPEGIKGYEPIG
jgi:hypothetical protein